MDMELNFLWIVLILIVALAAAFYSICRGCRGLRETRQAGHSGRIRSFVAPYAGLVQQLRAEENHQSRLFLISGASVWDKNPPSYDDIMESPPSYEETVKTAAADDVPMTPTTPLTPTAPTTPMTPMTPTTPITPTTPTTPFRPMTPTEEVTETNLRRQLLRRQHPGLGHRSSGASVTSMATTMTTSEEAHRCLSRQGSYIVVVVEEQQPSSERAG